MDIKQTLGQFGLGGKKADVYLAALELGGASVIDIAKKAGIKRTTVYDILLELQKDRLVSQTMKGKKRLFFGEDPEKIKKDFEKKESLLNEILPMLRSVYNVKGAKPKIRFYEGIEGLRECYSDSLKYSGEILAIGGEDTVKNLGHDWILNYIKKRIKKGIHVRGIVAKSEFIEKEYVSKDQGQFRTSKLIDSKKYPFPIEINIYGYQRVFFVSARDQVAVIIESAEIYQAMKSFFELLWDLLPEVKIQLN